MNDIKKQIEDFLGDESYSLFADGFDDAILGVSVGIACRDVVVYDYDKCLEILLEKGLSHEDAIDFLEYNTINAYVGEYTPIFVRTNFI